MPEEHSRTIPVKIKDRFIEKGVQQTPGPSDYSPYAEGLQTQHPFSFKGPLTKMDWADESTTPGPGQYNVRSRTSGPSWTIRDRYHTQEEQKELETIVAQRSMSRSSKQQ